jgi:alcohol dehydrogenase
MRDSASARALVLERPRRLVLHDIPLPAVGDDVALVRVQACGREFGRCLPAPVLLLVGQ